MNTFVSHYTRVKENSILLIYGRAVWKNRITVTYEDLCAFNEVCNHSIISKNVRCNWIFFPIGKYNTLPRIHLEVHDVTDFNTNFDVEQL